MKIEVINDKIELTEKFRWFIKTDVKCPECNQKGLSVKYRYNGIFGDFHKTSGVLLCCNNWGKCRSWWNKGTPAEKSTWHTWITSEHILIDANRGFHGRDFMKKLKNKDKKIYNKVKLIDKQIMNRKPKFI